MRSPGRKAHAASGRQLQLAAVPVLVFFGAPVVAADAFGAACFGGSERMPPQGSLDALASGIFFSVSL
ncbi:hypothetical protein ACVIQW_004539 [Bradyrhizobium diazoefficiens]